MLLTLLMMLTVKEPARRGVSVPAQSGKITDELSLFLRDNRATVFFIVSAFSLGGIAVVGYLAWVPEFLRRTFGWNMSEIGLVFGSLMAIVGTTGTLFGGWFVDRLAQRGTATLSSRIHHRLRFSRTSGHRRADDADC